jgi:hypothetical protein
MSILRGYHLRTDEDLGQSDMIQTDEGGRFIKISMGKLYMESQPIASRDGLVGTGMTCYRARGADSDRWTHVVKFQWRWVRDRSEDGLLELASETKGKPRGDQMIREFDRTTAA